MVDKLPILLAVSVEQEKEALLKGWEKIQDLMYLFVESGWQKRLLEQPIS